MSDKRERQVYQQMKARYVGLGNADTTREEFISNAKRDTYAALVGNKHMLTHLSVATGKPKQLLHQELIEKMANS
ncbi:hypothetical protein DAMA08_033200 [Martiniozyma asiatica (nom. inval.)]|nr:hypothetical protein DAMA08_033200 [Martiniozyma asiatica]